MSGVNFKIARQSEQLLVNARIELGGILARVARQVGPAYRPYEQRIAGQHEPRPVASLKIGHEKTDTFRGMARRVDNPNERVAELDRLAVLQRLESKANLRMFVQTIF